MGNSKKYQQPLSKHWFFGPALKNKKNYLQVILASVFINLFALASAFFIMIVYDRIVPNNAIESLIALTIGVLMVIGFDFVPEVAVYRSFLHGDRFTSWSGFSKQ